MILTIIGVVTAALLGLQPSPSTEPLASVRLKPVVIEADPGPVTSMARWKGPDGREVLGIAGLKNIVHVATDGAIIGAYPTPPLDSNGAPGARLAWVNADNEGAPELITLEYPMSRTVKLLSAEGALKWTWSVPEKIDAPFGIQLVHPFMKEGMFGVAVWVDGDPGFLIDEKGVGTGRHEWGSANDRNAIHRIGDYADQGVTLVYGANAKVRVVGPNGEQTHQAVLPRRNRYIREVIGHNSSKESPAVVVSSTFGHSDERVYKIAFPKGKPPEIKEADHNAMHDWTGRAQARARLWPQGPVVAIRCLTDYAQAPGAGISGKLGVIELSVGDEQPRELTLAPRNGRPLPVFPPVAFDAGLRPDGTSRILIGWETGLYELVVGDGR